MQGVSCPAESEVGRDLLGTSPALPYALLKQEDQVTWVIGLSDMLVEASSTGQNPVRRSAPCGHGYEHGRRRAVALPHATSDVQPSHTGHHYIDQRRVGGKLNDRFDNFIAAVDASSLMARLAQYA